MCHLFVSALLAISLRDYCAYCFACVCVCVCAHVSGRVYLGWIDVVEHHYGCAVVVQHQSPEVLYCVWKRVLGHYECRRLLVTLKKRKETKAAEQITNLSLNTPHAYYTDDQK